MTTFHVPSRTFNGSHTVRFDGACWSCTCLGYSYQHKRKPDFECFHIRQTQDSLSSQVIEIEGAASPEMIRYVISDFISGLFLLRTHYAADCGHLCRYGYAPRFRDAKARIGLKPEARRELLAVVVSAVIATLTRLMETLEKVVAA